MTYVIYSQDPAKITAQKNVLQACNQTTKAQDISLCT